MLWTASLVTSPLCVQRALVEIGIVRVKPEEVRQVPYQSLRANKRLTHCKTEDPLQVQ
jgi:hypothetical protein